VELPERHQRSVWCSALSSRKSPIGWGEQLTSILRFILTDTETRDFRVERWCFRGRIDDWIFVDSGKLADLAQALIPTRPVHCTNLSGHHAYLP
jgi:hypothetical protein